jgi:putative copper resistance protein D
MPRFFSPDVKQLTVPAKEVRRLAAAEGRTIPAAFVPGLDAFSVNSPADIAWSEYNHNWAGIFVLMIGILALLSRHPRFGWAKMWPLIFFGLAAFLFLRSDPENWPLGPNSFWESFAVTDVLQHRIAVLFVILFAIFQWRVETHRVKSHLAALVFPGVCALGGVVLLTHTHALSNVKEEMLVELSHVPLAICAVIAGWSRWLELRLPDSAYGRKHLAWVWPVCFILIGLILLGYHEADFA